MLTSISIPEGVTLIGRHTFFSCSELVSIVIPNSVTSIEYCAFYPCSSLETVYYKGTAKDWDGIDIDSTNDGLLNATRYYFSEGEPDEAQWQASEYWWHYDPETSLPTPWTKNQ